MLGHKPISVMKQIMSVSDVPHHQIQGLVHFKCDDCPEPPPRSHPIRAPSRYAFNYEVIVDVLEIKDADAERYSWLSIVCNGTPSHIVVLVRVGGGQPSSKTCWRKFCTR